MTSSMPQWISAPQCRFSAFLPFFRNKFICVKFSDINAAKTKSLFAFLRCNVLSSSCYWLKLVIAEKFWLQKNPSNKACLLTLPKKVANPLEKNGSSSCYQCTSYAWLIKVLSHTMFSFSANCSKIELTITLGIIRFVKVKQVPNS